MPDFKIGDRVYHAKRKISGELAHLHPDGRVCLVDWDDMGMRSVTRIAHRKHLSLEGTRLANDNPNKTFRKGEM